MADLLRTQLAFLAFRPVKVAVERDFKRWFVFVLLITWLVGVGRYWDHPSAELWQYLGLGSVAYIFCLSALLFVVVWPLRPSLWSFKSVLIFVGLTSLPALLYAIPIERFVSLRSAQSVNAWFLGVVALWRVALLVHFLIAYAKLHWFIVLTLSAMLLSGIVVSLSLLNLEHVVFDLMAGIRETDASPNDVAYKIVLGLALYSLLVFPVALVIYLGAVARRYVQLNRGSHEPERLHGRSKELK